MANEKRLIEVNSLIAYFEEQCDIAAKDTEIESAYVLAALKCCIDLFQNFPTVDAVEVVHGRWNPRPHHKFNRTGQLIKYCDFYYCSECGTERPAVPPYNYCPNCGAKMDGDGNG